ncbi:MAG: sodium:calcium antiporter [Luteolibacter sp.]
MMLNDFQSLAVGLLLAGIGGEVFLRGVVGLAQCVRVSASIIAATIAAFATSSPEFFIALSSATAGEPEISLGDALGSNVMNVALILGLAIMIAAIPTTWQNIRREFFGALLAPILVGALAVDGKISRLDGCLLVVAFFSWLALIVIEARKQREESAPSPRGETGSVKVTMACLVGLACLIAGGNLVVEGAKELTKKFGISEFAIGATMVAAGTSMPELATTLVAQLRGKRDISLSTILGSNIFNGLWIIGIAAMICPIDVSGWQIKITLITGLLTVLMLVPSRRGFIGRSHGIGLLIVYVAYVTFVLRK